MIALLEEFFYGPEGHTVLPLHPVQSRISVSLDIGKLETRRLVYGVYRCILRSIIMVGKLAVRVTEGDTRL